MQLIVAMALLVHIGAGGHDGGMVAACLAILHAVLAIVVPTLGARSGPTSVTDMSSRLVSVASARAGRHPPALGTILRL